MLFFLYLAHKFFQHFSLYIESKSVTFILDKVLTNLSLVSHSDQLVKNTVVEILVNLQLKDHIDYFILSHDGFISLLNICSFCNIDEVDKLILDILIAYVNRSESKLSRSKDRAILTKVSDEICHNVPLLSKLFNYQPETKSDLLEVINTDIIMDWIRNPSVCRISIVDLVITHSKNHWEYFATAGVNYLSDIITEENIDVYLPLFKSVILNHVKESK